MTDGIATTRVTQEVRNPTERPQEATYLFPLPVDAAVSDFALWVDGERWDAELLPSADARRLYENIVRERRDPYILEYACGGLFRARDLSRRAGGWRSRWSTLRRSPRVAGLAGSVIPSPARRGDAKQLSGDGAPPLGAATARHLLPVARRGHSAPRRERGGGQLRGGNVAPRGSFDLVYGTGQGEVAATLLSYRRGNDDGTFLLLLAPRPQSTTTVAKDVILVLDTSGSMSGPKIQQARGALRYVLENLNGDDRFGVITFNSVVESFADSLQPMDALRGPWRTWTGSPPREARTSTRGAPHCIAPGATGTALLT